MKVLDICIGDVIKKVMSDRKMTKAELARRLGIRPQSVEYLLKRRSIDTDMLYQVSVALDYDFSRLYSIDGSQRDLYLEAEAGGGKVARAKVVVELDLNPEDLAKLDVRRRVRRYLLEGEGCAISRRTVAKYRDELGIPSASGRKHCGKPQGGTP